MVIRINCIHSKYTGLSAHLYGQSYVLQIIPAAVHLLSLAYLDITFNLIIHIHSSMCCIFISVFIIAQYCYFTKLELNWIINTRIFYAIYILFLKTILKKRLSMRNGYICRVDECTITKSGYLKWWLICSQLTWNYKIRFINIVLWKHIILQCVQAYGNGLVRKN